MMSVRRIKYVIDYINTHLSDSLSVEQLAKKSCWSRWQLQRVFLYKTGLTLAQYVRELRLSMAAEALVCSNRRQIDIALSVGFASEVAFNRCFRQFFNCTPGAYRKRGLRVGQRTALTIVSPNQNHESPDKKLLQIRIETRSGFYLAGVHGYINGIFSDQPNYSYEVPNLWGKASQIASQNKIPFSDTTGVIMMSSAEENTCKIPYWAGIEIVDNTCPSGFQIVEVPAQQYAVIPYAGPIAELHETLTWFIVSWLPGSDFCGVDGCDLEHYGPDFDIHSDSTYMEYWVPVQRRSH